MRDITDLENLDPVVTVDEILVGRQQVNAIHVDESIVEYVLNITNATRSHDDIRLGISTRGARFLLQASKGYAFVQGREFVVPDDVITVAPFVIGHRIVLKHQQDLTEARRLTSEILKRVAQPV